MQRKAQQAEAAKAKAVAGSGTWWAMDLSAGGKFEKLSTQHRRWRATMFPFQQLGSTRCPMCSLPGSNVHLAKDCSHWEIDRMREDAFHQLDVVMEEWQGNNIPEGWAGAWPQMSRAQQLVAVLRADFSPGNPHLWALASDTLQTAWESMARVVDGLEEE